MTATNEQQALGTAARRVPSAKPPVTYRELPEVPPYGTICAVA